MSEHSPDELYQPEMPPTTATTDAVPTSVDDTLAQARPVDHHSYQNGSQDGRRAANVSSLGKSNPEMDLKVFYIQNHQVIFDKVAEPIHVVMDLRNVFVPLKDCTKALNYIYRAGWIHCGISCGNVYLYKGRELLGGSAHAKRIGTDGMHEVRAGTLNFMATEVLTCSYERLPVSEETAIEVKIFKALSLKKGIQEQNVDQNIQSVGHLRFYYNDLHDPESMWWIPVWMLLFHDDRDHPETDGLKRASRSLRVRQLFPRNLYASDRRTFLQNEMNFATVTGCLPKSYASVVVMLDALRAYLLRAYDKVEAALPAIKRPVHAEVHAFYYRSWNTLMDLAEGIVLVPTRSSSKRKATEEPSTNDSSPAPAPKSRRYVLTHDFRFETHAK